MSDTVNSDNSATISDLPGDPGAIEGAATPGAGPATGGAHAGSKAALAVGAIGVVFGDIGTSPLYAFRETFLGEHSLAIDQLHVYGVVSLIFWSMTLIVSIQYVSILMRADNNGQGGTLALVALLTRHMDRSRYGWLVIVLGVFATALFYGDSMITPAISVLSAVEGLTVVNPGFESLVIPIALVLLIGLFLIQKRGTHSVGKLFAPVMIVYFTTIAVLGIVHIVQNPYILQALNPWYAVQFFLTDGTIAFLNRDRAAFDAARARLAAVPKPAGFTFNGPDGKPLPIRWPLNMNVFEGFDRCWGQPYKAAYACATPMRVVQVPDRK